MRISDWSSDVCSSDLSGPAAFKTAALNHSATCPCPRRHSAGAALGKRNLCDLRPGAALTRIVAASPVQGWCIRGIPCLWVSDDRQQAIRIRASFPLFGRDAVGVAAQRVGRSEEHTSELQSLMRISYAVFCLQKKKHIKKKQYDT